jgi:hypothetical protein
VNPVLESNSKAKPQKKLKHPVAPEPLPACLELKGQPIEVQKFLQSVVHEFQRSVGESCASEDTWSFMRYLNDEDLEKYAATKVLLARGIHRWKSSSLSRTQELNEGCVREQVTTHQPATMWSLNSNGIMEQELIGALAMRVKHAT